MNILYTHMLMSVCIFCRSSITRRYRRRQGHWQAAGNSGMHHYIRKQLSALAPSPSRPGHAARHLAPSHHTTQSIMSPILAAVYIYSRRAASSVIRTETRLGKRASYDARAASISHLSHSQNTLSHLLHSSMCLRNSDMH
jgi:hypothetical protein